MSVRFGKRSGPGAPPPVLRRRGERVLLEPKILYPGDVGRRAIRWRDRPRDRRWLRDGCREGQEPTQGGVGCPRER